MAANWIVLAVLAILCGGVLSQFEFDLCASNPCMHDGTCTQRDEFYFDCECSPGFTDLYCEEVYSDECLSNPCQNGGTCVLGRCSCHEGYTGTFCEEHEAGVCLSNPCQNGGTCWGQADNGALICTCLGLFGGENCERHLTDGALRANETGCCLSGPCQNGGTCTENADTGFSCECIDGFSGATCQSRGDFCLSGPCQHGGTCNEDTDTCTCDENLFFGEYCEAFTGGVCLSDPCIYGDCVATDGGASYQCNCYDAFTGSHCEMIGDACVLNGGARIHMWTALLSVGLLAAFAAQG